MSPNPSIAAQIASLARSVQSTGFADEAARQEALGSARGLLQALESPVERILQDVVVVRCLSLHPCHL